jgi:hypothetical protein
MMRDIIACCFKFFFLWFATTPFVCNALMTEYIDQIRIGELSRNMRMSDYS